MHTIHGSSRLERLVYARLQAVVAVLMQGKSGRGLAPPGWVRHISGLN